LLTGCGFPRIDGREDIMLTKRQTAGLLGLGLLAVSCFAQPQPAAVGTPDAQRTREEFVALLQKYPPTVRATISLDNELLSNKEYLAPYPALATYLGTHPEITRDPSYYVGRLGRDFGFDSGFDGRNTFEHIVEGVGVFAGFGMAIGLLTWLIRTLVDYRRWHRLATVQTNVHTRLLERFTANEDLLAYIQSPAGSKFLESSPITLDPGQRSMGAPLGRILWSLQAGLVLAAAGLGLQYAAGGLEVSAAQTLHVLGVLGLALGLGFIGSAVASYLISSRMGLLQKADAPVVQG
jgi:hypothetical protein